MAINPINRTRAKHIRRRLEDSVATSHYLCRSHDPRERQLLSGALRIADELEHISQRLRSQAALLMEIDDDENRRHLEHLRNDQECNGLLVEDVESTVVEAASKTKEPVLQAPVLVTGTQESVQSSC